MIAPPLSRVLMTARIDPASRRGRIMSVRLWIAVRLAYLASRVAGTGFRVTNEAQAVDRAEKRRIVRAMVMPRCR